MDVKTKETLSWEIVRNLAEAQVKKRLEQKRS
jgi:hypothetical protein